MNLAVWIGIAFIVLATIALSVRRHYIKKRAEVPEFAIGEIPFIHGTTPHKPIPPKPSKPRDPGDRLALRAHARKIRDREDQRHG